MTAPFEISGRLAVYLMTFVATVATVYVFWRNLVEAAQASAERIDADRAVNYKCDAEGTALNYEAIGAAVCAARSERPIGTAWRQRIDEDVKKRGR